ncbi:MAG: Spx/MgsR family RNA polymerase-binding regulatory protein [Bacilli bacterium]
MIKVYTSPSCSSCRKVKKYFQQYKIPYVEKNILSTPLYREDIYKMLMNSENGFEDIISTRSNVFKDLNVDLNKMKTNELVEFIVQNPSVLKRPIIVTDYEIQVGYNDDDIELFLPQELRDIDCLHCVPEKDCEYIKAIKIVEKSA